MSTWWRCECAHYRVKHIEPSLGEEDSAYGGGACTVSGCLCPSFKRDTSADGVGRRSRVVPVKNVEVRKRQSKRQRGIVE